MLVDDLLSDGELYNTNMEASGFQALGEDNKNNKSDLPEEKKIDYAEGVRRMLLKDGKVLEATQEEEDEVRMEEMKEGSLHGSLGKNQADADIVDDVFSANMFDSTFKSRKQLSDILGNNKTPKTILRLNILGHAIIIFVLALTFVDFFVTNAQFKQIKDNVNLINLSYMRIAEIQNIVAKTRDIFLIQLSIAPYDGQQTTDTYATIQDTAIPYIKNNITMSTNLIQDIQRELQVQSKDLIINQKNIELTTTNAILMESKIGGSKSYDLNEATRQVVTMAINLKDEVDTVKSNATPDFMKENINWYFITQNCFNKYLDGLFSSSAAYVQDLTDRTNNMGGIFLIFFLIALLSIFLGIVCLVPSLWSVNRQKQEILGLFLYLNEDGIKNLYAKCEKLMSNLQVGEDDEADDDMDDQSVDKAEKNELEIPEGGLGKRKKNFKTNWKTNKCFLFMIIGFGLILESYFIFNFYQNKAILKDMQSLTKEINATSAAQSFFYFTANTQAMMFLNENQTVLGRKSEDLVKDNINNMFELDSTIHEEHSINVGIHSDEYKETYNNMMMLKPCSIMASLKQPFNSYIGEPVCTAFASGTLGQGMALGLARHYENMRNMYSKYLQIQPDPANPSNPNYTNPDLTACYNKILANKAGWSGLSNYNKLQLHRICLMEAAEAREIDTMLFIYIRNLFKYLVENLQNEINKFLDSNISVRLALMITLIVFLFFCYLFLWLPLIGRFTTDNSFYAQHDSQADDKEY